MNYLTRINGKAWLLHWFSLVPLVPSRHKLNQCKAMLVFCHGFGRVALNQNHARILRRGARQIMDIMLKAQNQTFAKQTKSFVVMQSIKLLQEISRSLRGCASVGLRAVARAENGVPVGAACCFAFASPVFAKCSQSSLCKTGFASHSPQMCRV